MISSLYHISFIILLCFSYISIMRKRFVAQGNALIFVRQSSHFVSVFIKRVFNISGIKARGLSLRSSVSAQHLKSQLHFWSSLPTGLCGHTWRRPGAGGTPAECVEENPTGVITTTETAASPAVGERLSNCRPVLAWSVVDCRRQSLNSGGVGGEQKPYL